MPEVGVTQKEGEGQDENVSLEEIKKEKVQIPHILIWYL